MVMPLLRLLVIAFGPSNCPYLSFWQPLNPKRVRLLGTKPNRLEKEKYLEMYVNSSWEDTVGLRTSVDLVM